MVDIIEKALDEDHVFDINLFHSSINYYAAFFRLFGTSIVPHSKIKKMVIENPHTFEDKFTPDDEALALIIFDNNVERWAAETKFILEGNPANPGILLNYKISKQDSKHLPLTKYTMGKNESSNNLRSGWTQRGIVKYCSYLKDVKSFRSQIDFQQGKELTIEIMRALFHGKQKNTSKRGNNHSVPIDEEEADTTENVLESLYKQSKFFHEV